MDRRDLPAVHLRNVSQVRHIGKVPFGYGDGRFFNLAGPHRAYAAAGGRQREHAYPVKKAPQLNVRHDPGCRVPLRQEPLPAWLPQSQAARQPQCRFSRPRLPHRRRQSACGNAAAYPGAYLSRPCVPRERCHLRTAGDTKAGRWGKSPPQRQGGSIWPPVPYQYPAHRSMRRSDKPKVVSLVQPPFLSVLRKARVRPTPPPLPPGRGTALENLYPRRLFGKKHNREKSVKGASGTACGGAALDGFSRLCYGITGDGESFISPELRGAGQSPAILGP
ncbi:Uncharacterised protein [Clostridioides difficile]|nr:Uncharacterised protein [Clostridioides difficile]